MPDQLEFKISEGLIKPIIEAKIHAAVINALGGHEELISKMVSCFLNMKVDSDGKESTYSSTKPRLDWLVHKILSDAVKKAAEEFIASKTDLFQKEFEKYFQSKAGSMQIVKAMQSGLIGSLSKNWTTKIFFNEREI